MNKFKKYVKLIFDKLKNAGVSDSYSVGLNLRIRMTNIICIMIVATGIMMIAFLNISGIREKLLLQMGLLLSYGLIILLNHLHRYKLSRIAFFILTNATIFFIGGKEGNGAGYNFYFFLLPLGTLIIFDTTEKKEIFVCILISLANYIVNYLFDFSQWLPRDQMTPEAIELLNYLNFFIYIFMITLMSYFFVSGFRVINNELLNEERQFADLEKLAHVGSWRIKFPYERIVASDELNKIFGIHQSKSKSLMITELLDRIHPDDRQNVYNGVKSVIDKGEFNEVSYRIIMPDESIRHVTSRAVPGKNAEGRVVHIDGALINLTRQRELRNRLAQNLKEKEELLSEMHHRVKNNLAVISGLIQLQAFKVDEQSQFQFFEIHNKINTIALIHEKFYKSDSLTKINLVNFVRELENRIARVIHIENCKIVTHFSIDDIYLAINYAIPCALIINELITNSYKHAFEGMTNGKISIKIHKLDDSFVLHYKDNGKGMNDLTDFNDTKNQGLSLISMLVKSMQYEFTTTNKRGFYFTMFKNARLE